MNSKESKQTAYQYNSSSLSNKLEKKNHGWAYAINQMIEQRYAFLAMEYENNGYLYRGMSAGLFQALIEKQFWHYAGEDRGTHFEQDLDILLLTQDFSDAFTIAKMWEKKLDACILIFRSELFNHALNEKKAAMMATAEPGVVFKYPFLTQSLSLDDIAYFIVSSELFELIEHKKSLPVFAEMSETDSTEVISQLTKLYKENRLIFPDPIQHVIERSQLENDLLAKLTEKAIFGAKTTSSALKPARKAE